MRIFLQKAYIQLFGYTSAISTTTLQPRYSSRADVQDQRNTDLTRNAKSLLKGDTNLTKGEASQVHYDSE